MPKDSSELTADDTFVRIRDEGNEIVRGKKSVTFTFERKFRTDDKKRDLVGDSKDDLFSYQFALVPDSSSTVLTSTIGQRDTA